MEEEGGEGGEWAPVAGLDGFVGSAGVPSPAICVSVNISSSSNYQFLCLLLMSQ